MLALTFLNFEEAEIADLTGLEHATNLTELDIGDNDVTDLAPIWCRSPASPRCTTATTSLRRDL